MLTVLSQRNSWFVRAGRKSDVLGKTDPAVASKGRGHFTHASGPRSAFKQTVLSID